MTIKAKQLFIIIGDDRTGKTTLQKLLIDHICGFGYDRLPVNRKFDITHPEIKRKYQAISFGNRSYQEKISDYVSIDNYFQNHFQPADIAFISSHLVIADIQQMITNGRSLFYNVNGIFWTNSIQNNPVLNSQVSLLDWDERFVIENPITENRELMDRQLKAIADSISFFLVNRTSIS